jgi:hypothetical protein
MPKDALTMISLRHVDNVVELLAEPRDKMGGENREARWTSRPTFKAQKLPTMQPSSPA